jgi:tRNA dimethylallyltransferase
MEKNVDIRTTTKRQHSGRNFEPENLPLIVIVGPTGSGKSDFAVKLATEFVVNNDTKKRVQNADFARLLAGRGTRGAEILCTDSRTIYQNMDIGTAKPAASEQGGIPHHGLDLVTPDQAYTVADYKKYADKTIEDIRGRGNVPIMVGGSGLYIDAVIYDYDMAGGEADPGLRGELNGLSIEELQERLTDMGAGLPENERNKRYLVRAIEKAAAAEGVDYSAPDRQRGVRKDAVVLGLDVERDELEQRIRARVEAMVAAGLEDEVRRLAGRYGWDIQAMQAPAYKAMRGYVEGTLSMAEAKQEFVRLDMKLAKRQRTWFRRNDAIMWLDAGGAVHKNDPQSAHANRGLLEQAVDVLTTQLNK